MSNAAAAAAAVLDPAQLQAIIQKGVAAAEKTTKLSPVFLKRDSFAGQACATGSLEIDYHTGGGIPAGRIVGISGPEHVGKSLLVTDIAEKQLAAGRTVVYMDAEGGSDPIFLKARGIDFDKYRGARNKAGVLKPGQFDYLHLYQPTNGDELVKYIHTLTEALPENRNPAAPPVIFILDSVVSLISGAMSEDIDSNKMAMHAKMYSEILPIINHGLVRTGCTFVYVNQLRMKPGVSYGSPEYEPAGSALQFFSSMRIKMNRTKPKFGDVEHPFINGFIPGAEWKEGGVWIEPHDGENKKVVDRYIHTTMATVKNKVYNPRKVFWMRLQFEKAGDTGHGMDPVFDVFTFWLRNGILKRKNVTTYTLTEQYAALVNGKEKALVGELPAEVTYFPFKKFIQDNKWLVGHTRTKYIESGKAFEKDDEVVDKAEPTTEEAEHDPGE
jgi:RecA/RadA recombinase